METAARSQAYCDEIKGVVAAHGLQISELTTHIFGQLVAVHPAYDAMCDNFAPEAMRGNPAARTAWAVERLALAAKASRRLGLADMGTFSGAFAWPYLFPFPQRPAGLIETAFDELARRWRPILDLCDEQGVNLCYEIHPGEDLHDGATFERFYDRVDQHTRCKILFDPSHFVLQQLDYCAYLDIYHEHIRMFHVKDAEFRPSGRQGIYGGYTSWIERAGRFRSLGDGQVDFKAIFSKLAQYDYDGWATLEWECCLKDQEDGAREGVAFIEQHICATRWTARPRGDCRQRPPGAADTRLAADLVRVAPRHACARGSWLRSHRGRPAGHGFFRSARRGLRHRQHGRCAASGDDAVRPCRV